MGGQPGGASAAPCESSGKIEGTTAASPSESGRGGYERAVKERRGGGLLSARTGVAEAEITARASVLAALQRTGAFLLACRSRRRWPVPARKAPVARLVLVGHRSLALAGSADRSASASSPSSASPREGCHSRRRRGRDLVHAIDPRDAWTRYGVCGADDRRRRLPQHLSPCEGPRCRAWSTPLGECALTKYCALARHRPAQQHWLTGQLGFAASRSVAAWRRPRHRAVPSVLHAFHS